MESESLLFEEFYSTDKKELASGPSSRLFAVKNKRTSNKLYALKEFTILKKDNDHETIKRRLESELFFLTKIAQDSNHPSSIPNFYCSKASNSKSGDLIYEMIFDFCPFSLKKTLSKTRGKLFPPEKLLNFARSLVEGLAYLQSSKVWYQYLKPSRLRIDESLTQIYLLLESSGTSQDVSKYERSILEKIEVIVAGNSSYLSPELMEAFEKHKETAIINPFKSDVFSLGIILLEIGGLKNPLKKKERNAMVWRTELEKAFEVLEKNYSGELKNEREREIFTEYLNLTKRCLLINSDDRPDFVDLSNLKLNIYLIRDCDEIIIPLDFRCSQTVFSLKTLIKQRLKIPEHQQRLFYNGRQLEDTQKLNYYNISNNDTILLVQLVLFPKHEDLSESKPIGTGTYGDLKFEDFHEWKPIGGGAYGSVYSSQNKTINNKSFAIKMISEENIETDREIALWESLKKKATPKAFPVYHSHYKENSNNYLVFDLYPKSLAIPLNEMMKNKRESPLDFQKLMTYWKSLVNALAFLQSWEICHRDIKPANILLDEKEEQVYLTDLGVSKNISSVFSENTVVGTLKYLSPELETAVANKNTQIKYDPFKSDVFSLGLVFLELGTLNIPLAHSDKEIWVKNIRRGIEDFAKIYEKNLKNHSESEKIQLARFTETLEKCLEFEAAARPDFIDLFKKDLAVAEGENLRELILFQEKIMTEVKK